MQTLIKTLTFLVLTATCLASPSQRWPFSRLEYPAALVKAQAEDKLLLVHFTSGYNPASERMIENTWFKKRVRTWVDEHAIAILVDGKQEAELASQFKIKATPTFVIIREGKEFDRRVGVMNSIKFMRWAKLLEQGKRVNHDLLTRSEKLRTSQDLEKRFAVAKDLAAKQLMDPARLHFTWLWDASRNNEAWEDRRWLELLPQIVELCKRDGVADMAFLLKRTKPGPGSNGMTLPDFALWREWTGMCAAFDQHSLILSWYDDNRDKNGRLFPNDTHSIPGIYMVSEVLAALEYSDRREDAIKLVGNPKWFAEALVKVYRDSLKELGPGEGDLHRAAAQHFASELNLYMGLLYGSLLSTGNFNQADSIAKLLLETLDTAASRLALVTYGLRATEASHRYFWRLLREAEAAGARAPNLRSVLEQLDRASDEMVTH